MLHLFPLLNTLLLMNTSEYSSMDVHFLCTTLLRTCLYTFPGAQWGVSWGSKERRIHTVHINTKQLQCSGANLSDKSFHCFKFSPAPDIFQTFKAAHLVCVKCYLILILLCYSLNVNGAEWLAYVYEPFVLHFLCNTPVCFFLYFSTKLSFSYCYRGINPFSTIYFEMIFSWNCLDDLHSL